MKNGLHKLKLNNLLKEILRLNLVYYLKAVKITWKRQVKTVINKFFVDKMLSAEEFDLSTNGWGPSIWLLISNGLIPLGVLSVAGVQVNLVDSWEVDGLYPEIPGFIKPKEPASETSLPWSLFTNDSLPVLIPVLEQSSLEESL